MLKGSCYCGVVRYEIDASPTNESACHCSICRRTSGAPYVAWFSVPPSSFRVVSGRPASFKSSEHATRTFCPACGTPLTFQSSRHPDEIDITTCSLENPEEVPPKDYTFGESRLSWVKLADGLPVHPTTRPVEPRRR